MKFYDVCVIWFWDFLLSIQTIHVADYRNIAWTKKITPTTSARRSVTYNVFTIAIFSEMVFWMYLCGRKFQCTLAFNIYKKNTHTHTHNYTYSYILTDAVSLVLDINTTESECWRSVGTLEYFEYTILVLEPFIINIGRLDCIYVVQKVLFTFYVRKTLSRTT